MSKPEQNPSVKEKRSGTVDVNTYQVPPLLVVLAASTIVVAVFYVAYLARENSMGSRPRPNHFVSLEEPVVRGDGASSNRPSRPSLRVAIAPVISPEKSLETYDELVDFLAGKLDRDAVILPRATYSEVNELVRYRRCDIAMVCTYPFVRGQREFGMEALVVPVIGGATTYHSLILVPRSAQATSILDLRGGRFASADNMSNSGWLFPATWLQNHGEEPDHFFSEVVFTGSHDRSVQAVRSGYVDGAAVDSLVYDALLKEDPSVSKGVRIIQKSPPFGMPPFVVHPKIEPALKEQLQKALLEVHLDPEGKKLISALSIERFEVPSATLYDSVREAAELWESRR